VIFIKKGVLFTIFCIFFFPLFAIPGIKDYIPTDNGQYVYYRDYSFTYEAYIGFLQYDANTYAIRYVAKNPSKGLPVIELLISVDPNNDKIEFTGEKIVQQVTNADTDVMNYMHDILYELVARRRKENNQDFSTTFSKTEDYPQFGGIVTIQFNAVIPLFNIESITAEDGTILLQSVIMGQITDKTEKGWNNFTGIASDIPPKAQFFDLKESNTEKKLSEEDFKALNAQWKQEMDNFFLMGNNALMFITDVKISERLSLIRRFSLSSSENTIFLQNKYIKNLEDGTVVLSNIIKTTDSDTYQIDIKILSPIINNMCTITGITTYSSYFEKNKNYFIKLVKDNSQN